MLKPLRVTEEVGMPVATLDTSSQTLPVDLEKVHKQNCKMGLWRSFIH